jgi:hypothetical protein
MGPRASNPALGLALQCLALLLLGGAARAGSLELRGSAGPGTWTGGGALNLDLGAGPWSMLASNDYTAVSGTSAPSSTNLSALDFLDAYDSSLQFKAGLDFSNDSINQILYAGPDLGFTYTDLVAGAAAAAGAKAGDGEDEDASTLWNLGFSAPIHGYSVNLGVNANQGFTKAKKNSGGVSYVIVTNQSSLDVTQFYPNLTLEVPVLEGAVVPSLLYGHDFYNDDPGAIAEVINRRFSQGNGGGRVGNLVGALYTDTLTAALVVKLPCKLSLSGSFSESQLISPYIWAVSADAYVNAELGESYSAKLGWMDSVEAGAASPQAAGSVTWNF